MQRCEGKPSCELKDLIKFFEIPAVPDVDFKHCIQEKSLLFVQVGCMLPNSTLVSQKKFGLLMGCTGVFIALFVVNFIDYMDEDLENGLLKWDLSTLTADDYTIQFKIKRKFYEAYKQKKKAEWVEQSKLKNREYTSDAQSFKFWLQHEMEVKLKELPYFDMNEENNFRIAVSTMTFRNAKIIKLLRERGMTIKKNNWEEQ